MNLQTCIAIIFFLSHMVYAGNTFMPLCEQAQKSFQLEAGALKAFKECVKSSDFPESPQRYIYLANVVIDNWDKLRHGTHFLSVVKKQARKKGFNPTILLHAPEGQLNALIETPCEERLTNFIALFKAVDDMKCGIYVQGCDEFHYEHYCFHVSHDYPAQDIIRGSIKRAAQRHSRIQPFALPNHTESEHAKRAQLFSQLLQRVSIADEDLYQLGIYTLPLSDSVAHELWQAQHYIINDNAGAFAELIDKKPYLALKMLDATGYTLLNTALNIHTFGRDRSYYIEHLLQRGSKCLLKDLHVMTKMTAAIAETTGQQKDAAALLSQFEPICRLLENKSLKQHNYVVSFATHEYTKAMKQLRRAHNKEIFGIQR